MSNEQGATLQRLLGGREVKSLLEAFAALAPQLGVMLIRPDLRIQLNVGSWPADTLADTAARAEAVLGHQSSPKSEPFEVDGCRYYPLILKQTSLGALVVRGGAAEDRLVDRVLHHSLIALLVESLERRSVAAEALACYREINLLYRAGERIGGSLDPETIPRLALEESHLIKADAGLVLLGDVAASFGEQEEVASLHEALLGVLDSLWQSGQPAILTEFPGAGTKWSAILWAPLRGSDQVLGGIVLGRRAGQPIFVANEEKLLMALAAPSALALQNANLFTDLEQTLNRTLEMKTLMDNVLSSIVSGVLTTDLHRQITLCNEAVTRILGLSGASVVGRPLVRALPGPFSRLAAIVSATAERGAATPGENLSVTVPGRGPLHLFVSCTPIRDAQGERRGAALVVNDLTEQREIEAERERIRQTFGRVVAPRVRDRLLAEPGNLRLDGSRHTITVLFADLHDFTPFCERTEPETLFRVLNSYLSAAAQAVLDQEGTLDKFIGDAVMAFWNAPDPQEDHALRAVRAALAMDEALRTHRASQLEGNRLEFSIGIHTGEAIVGNVGTAELFNYTAIGDTVNMAQRLESVADPGCILLSEATYRVVSTRVAANPRGEMRLKGRQQPVAVYELKGLVS
jgi:PAS domain S-box-containing protein